MSQNQLLTFSAFFFSYATFLLISYKTDPRYSLKPSRKTSFYRITGLSTLNRIIFLILLLVLSFFAGQNLPETFGIQSSISLQIWLPLGILAGLLTFFLGMPINLLIQIFRARYGLKKTRREEEILKIMFAKPLNFNEFIFFLSATTFLNGVIEELIFRGFLLTNLNLAIPSIISILIQAFLFFIPNLYQDVYNASITFYKGLMLGTFLILSNSIFVVIIARLTCDAAGLFLQARSMKKIVERKQES